jgi:SNF2 family DNA or RNA helicase
MDKPLAIQTQLPSDKLATKIMEKPLRPLWLPFTYFPHQETGIRWMLEKELVGTPIASCVGDITLRGGCQCDDMGLGKTIQMISTMVNHVLPTTLLLAPVAMIETWTDACQHAGLAVYHLTDCAWTYVPSPYPIPSSFIKRKPAVYLTNYEKLYRLHTPFIREWDRMVLDEAHKIRNAAGDMARVCRGIKAPIRWALTGTPLVNSLRDVTSLLAFLGVPHAPNFRWERKYMALLPQLMIHRSLESLKLQGPPRPEIHSLLLPFTTTEEEQFYHTIQSGQSDPMDKVDHAFLMLLRLRQISVHPQVYIASKRRAGPYPRPDWTTPSTKFTAIQEIMEQANRLPKDSTPNKFLVFCQFHDEMTLIKEFFVEKALFKKDHILMYHGAMNHAERTACLKRSKETTETTVLLLQLQAGGVGLNLQEHSHIIFVSPYWTSALMDQAVARAVRMGQTKTVHVYHLALITEKEGINIDNMVNEKADGKRRQLEALFRVCHS